jgi:hypothetical protein
VTTSNFGQSSLWAKAAEVASQIVKPLRSAAIQSPLGTRTPDVVPFQVKTENDIIVEIDMISVTQPSPKDSQASTSTPRAEQRPKGHFHRARIRARDNADAIIGGDLQNLTGELDAELQPGLGSLGPVRASERCILEVLDLPARALCARSRRKIRARRPRQGSRHIHDNHPFRWRLSCGKGIPFEGCDRRSARQAEDPAASAWPIASNLLAALLRSSSLPFTIESLA